MRLSQRIRRRLDTLVDVYNTGVRAWDQVEHIDENNVSEFVGIVMPAFELMNTHRTTMKFFFKSVLNVTYSWDNIYQKQFVVVAAWWSHAVIAPYDGMFVCDHQELLWDYLKDELQAVAVHPNLVDTVKYWT